MEAKLYSPVFVDLWEQDEYGSYENEPEEIGQFDAVQYEDKIRTALLKERMPEESERGLMAYYDEPGSVGEKVQSLFIDVEIHDRMLWGVATLDITEPLTADELDTLKDYLTGQYSDGWGEGFEQREIRIEDGTLNVHLWKHGDEFFIETQERFSQRLGLSLPPDALSREAAPLSPAEKAVDEPDASDSPEVAALRERLIDRIGGNLSEYFNTLRQLDNKGIADWTFEIAAITGAYAYMTEIHNFHTSELEYLLQFKDPLKVVASEFEADAIDNHSDIMWRIFHDQEALHGDYERMPETAAGDAPVEQTVLPEDFDRVVEDAVVAEVEAEMFAELRQRLTDRAQQNWDDFRSAPLTATAENIYHKAAAVLGNRDAFFFIQNYGDFTVEQLNCLLQFANPVDLVAGYLDPKSEIDEMPGILASIRDDQENLKQHYALARDPAAPGIEDLEQQLRDRLKDNYEVFKRDTMDQSKEGIFYSAAEILPVMNAYAYFTQEHKYIESDVDFLLKFENPLELITDRWSAAPVHVSYTQIVDGIFNDQERTLEKGGYTLMPDEPDPVPAAPEAPQKIAETSERPSVLDRIRQHAKEARERPAVPKDAPDRKKSGPEL